MTIDLVESIISSQEYLIKTIMENDKQINKDKQDGFFDLDLPLSNKCKHPSHEPPSMLYIPPGKGYRHICPNCGKITDLIPPQISL